MLEFTDQLKAIMPTRLSGSVVSTAGMTVSVAGFPAPVGSLVDIERQVGDSMAGEVIGFSDGLTLVYPLSRITGVRCGNRVRLVRTFRSVRVGDAHLGRVLDARGKVIDGRPQPLLIVIRQYESLVFKSLHIRDRRSNNRSLIEPRFDGF